MIRILSPALALLVGITQSVVALPVSAQDSTIAEPAADPIVVQGIKEIERQIDTLVYDYTTVSEHSPIWRYPENEYCPQVIGLSDQMATAIETRMRQVASAAGVKPAGPGCSTSALAIFADNRAVLLEEFKRIHPIYFQRLSAQEVTMQGRDDNVLSWKIIGRIDINGNPVLDNDEGWEYVNLRVGGSRLQSVTKPVVAIAVVLIEREAIIGFTPTQLADYILMRTLTDTDPSSLEAKSAPTILRLIDTPVGSAAPLSLTGWDFAYLQGRYASNEWSYGHTQAAKIRATMRRALLAQSQDDPFERGE